MNQQTLDRLPRRVLLGFVGTTAVVGIAMMSLGLLPSRNIGGVILPLYFAILLTVMAITYLLSGNTLMHHHRTGTIKRAGSARWFWWIVMIHFMLSGVLLVVSYFRWVALNA